MTSRGYIAIITGVVISSLLVLLGVVASISSFLGNSGTLTFEAKDTATAAAHGCLNHARLQLSLGAYGGGETLTIGSSTCTILPVQAFATSTVITATSTFQGAFTILRLTVYPTSLATMALEEILDF